MMMKFVLNTMVLLKMKFLRVQTMQPPPIGAAVGVCPQLLSGESL